MTPHPPADAERLLASILPADTRDSVLGDLVEEYTESQVPGHGRMRANWWYRRHVAGFVWRASRLWALALGSLLGARAVLDVTVQTTDHFQMRARMTSYAVIGLFLALGAIVGRRTRRVLGAVAIAVVAGELGCAMCLAVSVSMKTLAAFGLMQVRSFAGLDEAFDIPAIPMAVVGAACALCGAGVGRMLARSPTRRLPTGS